jgi:hypothetical protein
MPCSDAVAVRPGAKIRLVPPTMAALQSPFEIAAHASFRQTSDAEHPVRIVKLYKSAGAHVRHC